MCGVVGIFRRRGVNNGDSRRLAAMSIAVAHRGPDDHGYLQLDSASGNIALGRELAPASGHDVLLGSRRLAVIDPSAAGWQPMANAARDIFLVFNGAIYNYPELKRELGARGRRFASGSDTEVILQAYEEWGPDAVTRFNGMWALVLWDQRQRLLFCSRDRFGAKPLYYYVDDDLFVFASEIKALLPALPRRAAPDWPMIYAYLARNALCHTSATLLTTVKRLRAAHNLLVSKDAVKSSRYWDYRSQSHTYAYDRPEETFHSLLDDAVRLRLRSDVPVGVALSGGLDSTAIAALTRRHHGGAIKAFTAEFPGTPYDEGPDAAVMARSIAAEHYLIPYRPRSLADDVRRVVWHMDQPAPHPQVLPRWALMQTAAQQVKVILEGQGSDEMLAGYPRRYFPAWLSDEVVRLRSPALFAACANIVRAVASRRTSSARLVRAALERALRLTRRSRRRRTIDAFHPDFRAFGDRSREQSDATSDHGSRLAAALLRDHQRDLLPWLLMLGDTISMAHSLESRLPFLDYRLVEFCFALPNEWKYDGVDSKIVLRRVLKTLAPPEITARREKIAFNAPVERWIAAALETEVRPMLLSARARGRGIFEPGAVQNTLAGFAAGRLGHSTTIFRWLSLEIWFQLFIDNDARDLT